MIVLRLAILLLGGVLLAGCSTQSHHRTTAGTNDDMPAELTRVLRDYEKAWAAKDADSLAALFAPDGFVFPNQAVLIRGRDNIRSHYRGKGGPLYLTAVHWQQSGDVGYIIGEYAHDPDIPPSGKFTLTLTRIDGRWLIMSDMDSSNRRP